MSFKEKLKNFISKYYYTKSETDNLLEEIDVSSNLSQVATTGSYNDLTDKPNIPTVPSASSTTPSADTTNGSVGSGTTWAKADHTHPKSTLYAEASHTHTKSQISDFPTLSTVATSGSYNDLSNKPTIPTAYTHPTPSGLGGAKSSGLYKISTDANGHITGTASVNGSDLPSHNHTYSDLTNVSTVVAVVTYTDNSTETLNLLKYTPPSS